MSYGSPWHDLLLPLKGKRPTCSPVINFAQDSAFEKDVSISCTEKDELVYILSGVVDSRKTEMM